MKQQITDRLDEHRNNMNKVNYEFVDHCDYLELEDITPGTLPKENLNLLQMNVRGLISKQIKLQSLLETLENSSDVHCLLLCETWLTEDTKKLLNFNKHKFIGKEHSEKKVVELVFF